MPQLEAIDWPRHLHATPRYLKLRNQKLGADDIFLGEWLATMEFSNEEENPGSRSPRFAWPAAMDE